jgi:hypothetical protein
MSKLRRLCVLIRIVIQILWSFQVIQRVGSVAYKLQLPDSTKIHPVVHVSHLKRALGSGCVASPSLPTDSYRFSVPVKTLQRRTMI